MPVDCLIVMRAGATALATGRNWCVAVIVAGCMLAPATAQADPHGYVQAASYHTCAQQDGGLVCWGRNSTGQLGNGTYINSLTPVRVAGLSGVAASAAGWDNTCAVTRDGATWCWGGNLWGQLGDGTTRIRSRPVRMLGPDTSSDDPLQGSAEVVVGNLYICVRAADGRVWCAGENMMGQLGDGTRSEVPRPRVTAVQGIDDVVEVTSGFSHVCALRSDGTVWCWGRNSNSELGYPTTTWCRLGAFEIPCALTPGQVVGLTDVVHISAGSVHTCALRRKGEVVCWGANDAAQLGAPPSAGSMTPVAVIAGTTSISAGRRHSCATRTDGTLTCWGENRDGQLGNGLYTPWSVPTPALVKPEVVEVSSGGAHTCARRADRRIWCWGSNADGQLGYQPSPFNSTAVPTDTSYSAP